MPNRKDMESWVADALRAAGGKAETTAIRQYVWLTHENTLRASGPQFFRWQIDLEHALSSLRRRGAVRRVRDRESPEYWEAIGDMTNAFEAMCQKASEENWCWNLGCTTCANHDLRYGFAQIGLGRHPQSPDWERVRSDIDTSRDWPSVFSTADWPDSMKQTLGDTLLGSSLRAIPKRCNFPDWLGYMGIVLHMVADDEELARRLTAKWVPELRSMVEHRSVSRDRLKEVVRSGELLRWHHIDGIERDLLRAYRPDPV